MSDRSKNETKLLVEFQRAKETYECLQALESTGKLNNHWRTTLRYYVVLHLVNGIGAYNDCIRKTHDTAYKFLLGKGVVEKRTGKQEISFEPTKPHYTAKFENLKSWSFKARYDFIPNQAPSDELKEQWELESTYLKEFIAYFKNHKIEAFKTMFKASGFPA